MNLNSSLVHNSKIDSAGERGPPNFGLPDILDLPKQRRVSELDLDLDFWHKLPEALSMRLRQSDSDHEEEESALSLPPNLRPSRESCLALSYSNIHSHDMMSPL